jgi:hypothetical protein
MNVLLYQRKKNSEYAQFTILSQGCSLVITNITIQTKR